MSTNFFFKSLNIDNYRGISKLNIDTLRRVNFIGGLNGTGKSTLLEAIFLLLDRRNPMALMRAYTTRGIQIPFPNGLNDMFRDSNTKNNIKIAGKTSQGIIEIVLSLGPPPPSVNISTGNNLSQASRDTTTTTSPDQLGIHLKATLNGNEDGATYTQQISQDSVNCNLYQNSNTAIVLGALISPISKTGFLEDAQRLSTLIKQRRLPELIDAMKFINPDLKSFMVLQDGNQSTIYAELSSGQMLQSSMLGGGFQNVLSNTLLLMTMNGGVILFDEIDAAIHFSKLSSFWGLMARLANEQNCQIFVVTHSKECIENAIKGFIEEKKLADLQYIRLEDDDNQTDCVLYTGEELFQAIETGWEIR